MSRGRGSPRLSARAEVGAAVLLALGLAAGGATAQAVSATQVSVFAGRHVDNTWQEVFGEPVGLDYADAGLVGVAIGRDWRRPGATVSAGVELQVDLQFGSQNHVEINLPVVARYHPPRRIAGLSSVAAGVGPSYATRVPAYEVASRGDSRQFLVHWMLEAEFAPAQGSDSAFVRLHHRSGMFGIVADEGASNALVLGVRRRW